MAKPSEQAIAIVAQAWCHPTTENLNPNMAVSLVMAAKVDEMLELLREAYARILSKWGDEDVAWTEKYTAWLKANHLDPDDTKEIVVK